MLLGVKLIENTIVPGLHAYRFKPREKFYSHTEMAHKRILSARLLLVKAARKELSFFDTLIERALVAKEHFLSVTQISAGGKRTAASHSLKVP